MILLHNKEFVPFISSQTIDEALTRMATALNQKYAGANPLFIGILNGSFMFASDLFKKLNFPAEITFVKLISYKGTKSTGHVLTSIGLEEDIDNRPIIVLDDILDTGKTLYEFKKDLFRRKPTSVEIAVFLHKKECTVHDIHPDYVGIEIPNKFVVGYGMDYDGLGRYLPELYQIK